MLAALAAALLLPVLYVGDSLGVGTLPGLAGRPGLAIEGDARVGRPSSEGVAVLRARLRPRHRVVVFDLGTNDWSVPELTKNLGRARRQAGARPLVVFTVNKPGAPPFNRAIRRFAARSSGVVLVDWHAVAWRGHLLASDGIHSSATGYAHRAALVAAVLARATRRARRP
jgi:hypothetical protein